ncbi:MAG: tRNA pseudouridine(38-40) synthase TruA, partial [Candidatus Omnitrophica bacterium]|nr:tRNA pseudouridine(38-40) synthase TruA [Candidatus Omnitrophota bacterium]
MVKNIFLEIEYDGTNYFGWQIQSKEKKAKGRTIQEKIQQALEKLFNRKVKINYAGRTDRGVHAYSQCINFKIDTNIPLKNIRLALNSFLPSDISIKRIKKVPLDFHARFNAKSKIYRY